MALEKPLYTIKIELSGCIYDIRVNDCPVIEDQDGYGLTTEIPINHWLFDGENRLKASLTRISRQYGKCDLSIWVKEFERDGGKRPVRDLVLETKPIELGGNALIEKEIIFDAKVPFQKWMWSEVEATVLTSEDRKAIVEKAKELWESLQKKDLNKIKKLLAFKSKEIIQAKYQTEKARNKEIQTQLEDILEGDWIMGDFDIDDLVYLPYGNGRLIKFMDSESRESPVFFTDPKKTIASYMELFFYKNKDLKWNIIR